MQTQALITLASLSFGLSLVTGCKGLFQGDTEVPVKKTCVDDLEAVKSTSFGLETELSKRLTATLVGTVHFEQATRSLDEEVAVMCTSLAKQLGAEDVTPEAGNGTANDAGAGESAWYEASSKDEEQEAKTPEPLTSKEACAIAAKQIRKVREDAGTVLVVEAHEPACSGRMADYQACALSCDGSLPPKAKMRCGEENIRGRCADDCTGRCVEKFADDCGGSCRGTCQGRCMKGFYGTCEGRCVGDCDGQTTSGKCEGLCDGKCLSAGSGSCEGRCEGRCSGACFRDVRKKSCEGTCVGSCSEEMSDARCTDVVPPVEMIPACKARCDTELAAKQHCEIAHVDVVIYATKEEREAGQLKTVLEKQLPAILVVDAGKRGALERAATALQEELTGLKETSTGDAKVERKIGSCLAAAESKYRTAAETLESFRKTRANLMASTRN